MRNYLKVEVMLIFIDEPNRAACLRLVHENLQLFQETPGSTHKHQAWPGGYLDHVHEVMNIAIMIYWTMKETGRPLPFSLSSLLLVVFLHDLEKPWKYELSPDGKLSYRQGMKSKEDHEHFRMEKLAEYGITLTPEEENGLRYVEGEAKDYSAEHRVMNPLAAMAHMCDVASARIWFDYPLEKDDPWHGAERVRD